MSKIEICFHVSLVMADFEMTEAEHYLTLTYHSPWYIMNKYFKAGVSNNSLKYYIFTFYTFCLFNTIAIRIFIYSSPQEPRVRTVIWDRFLILFSSPKDLFIAIYFYISLQIVVCSSFGTYFGSGHWTLLIAENRISLFKLQYSDHLEIVSLCMWCF